MNPTLYLSCLVVIVCSLAWTSRAAPWKGDQTFDSEATRLMNIYKGGSVDQLTKLRSIPDLMDFYEKYGNQLQLTPEERIRGGNALRQYKEEQAKQPLVEGAPAQGCPFIHFSRISPDVLILRELITKMMELNSKSTTESVSPFVSQ